MTEQRYYSRSQIERAAQQIDLWCDQLKLAYRRELWSLAQSEQHARDALILPDTAWGLHAVASEYLDVDVPRHRRLLHAALHILDFAPASLRIDFVLGNEATRARLMQYVIIRGGIYDRTLGRGTWVELAV